MWLFFPDVLLCLTCSTWCVCLGCAGTFLFRLSMSWWLSVTSSIICGSCEKQNTNIRQEGEYTTLHYTRRKHINIREGSLSFMWEKKYTRSWWSQAHTHTHWHTSKANFKGMCGSNHNGVLKYLAKFYLSHKRQWVGEAWVRHTKHIQWNPNRHLRFMNNGVIWHTSLIATHVPVSESDFSSLSR